MHIVHISSVHNSQDNRIRQKMLGSVADNGWDAALVSGDAAGTGSEGVRVITVKPGNRQRWQRMLVTAPLAICKAFRLKADVYHLHDPELLPWASLLFIKGTPVIYDVHEDYVTSVRQKKYLPKALRNMIASMVGALEKIASSKFHKIIAEKYYSRRFPDALEILNYPDIEPYDELNAFDPNSSKLLYTGKVSIDRGGVNMACLAAGFDDVSVTIAGYCPETVAKLMQKETLKQGSDRLHIIGKNRYLSFDEIKAVYEKGCWMAGIALFPYTDHYKEKALTKFFEYMAVGLPIIATDFPAWKKVIEEQGAGLCVNPNDMSEIKGAIDWLRTHPEQAMEMGAKGKQLVKNKYSWRTEARKLLKLYENIQ